MLEEMFQHNPAGPISGARITRTIIYCSFYGRDL